MTRYATAMVATATARNTHQAGSCTCSLVASGSANTRSVVPASVATAQHTSEKTAQRIQAAGGE
jgi:hypothetical protein